MGGVVVGIGLALAVGAITWRLAGGVFEDPREDDVFSLAYLGLAWASGGWAVRTGCAGWRPMAGIGVVSLVYAAAAVVTLVLSW